MSVVVNTRENPDGQDILRLYLKGSPEKVHEMCDQSTLPSDYQDVLDLYTSKGYRVIALAYKNIDE